MTGWGECVVQFHLRTLKVCLVTRPKVLEENGILFRAWICGAGTEWGCDVNLGCAFINIMAVAIVMMIFCLFFVFLLLLCFELVVYGWQGSGIR